MVVQKTAASWTKRGGLLALLAFSWACSDVGNDPMGLASNETEPQFSGSTQGPPPALVLPLTPQQLSFQGINRTVTWSSCASPLDGTFKYSVRGNAFGAYNGTFVETGTVKISGGRVTALTAQFTITGNSLFDPDGGTYKVRGRKELTAGGLGECLNVGQIVDPTVGGDILTYVAKIYTPSGHRFADDGTSSLFLTEEGAPGTAMETHFEEGFVSTKEAATPCVDAQAGLTVGPIGVGVQTEQCPPDLDL